MKKYISSDNFLHFGKYFGKFAIVGISGIVVNQGLLVLLKEAFDVRTAIAGIIAIELSIITNFLLNNFWTWKDNQVGSFWVRFLKYHLVTSVSGGINYLILLLLTHLGMHYFIANLAGIAFGMVINFFLNHFWTFGVKTPTPDIATSNAQKAKFEEREN
ncbi:MAG: GtrA family protein [Candidatus Zixiibacteriota bacterium]